MSQVYIIQDNSTTLPMKRIHCANEDVELQQLLEKNPQLMPGDQIRPDDPRRWFLIRREMPVPDPATGDNRWSIDHFFVDQSGTPTFVECKRFMDTRSRREVVGQMMEYAANGQFYWDKELIRNYASGSAKGNGMEIEEAIRDFQPDIGESVDDFIEQIENNLREGQVRLVFFMEEAPAELKSIVDFLNRQMERSEVLIIEAKQYEKNGFKVVVPILFGFTEEARRVKRTVTVTSGSKQNWTEDLFLSEINTKNYQPAEMAAIMKLLNYAKSDKFTIRWGTGKKDGTFSIVGPSHLNKSLVTVFTTGRIDFPLGSMRGDEYIEGIRDGLAGVISELLKVDIPEDYQNRYPTVQLSSWVPKVDAMLEEFDRLVQQYENLT